MSVGKVGEASSSRVSGIARDPNIKYAYLRFILELNRGCKITANAIVTLCQTDVVFKVLRASVLEKFEFFSIAAGIFDNEINHLPWRI